MHPMSVYPTPLNVHLRTQIDPNTVVVGDFSTLLSPIDRSSRQKNQQRNSRIEWYHRSNGSDRVFHPTTAQYTFFSATHGTFSKIDHILCHKASLNKYKKTEITPCIRSDHNSMKQELNNKRSIKFSSNWRLNNTLLIKSVSLKK
jgi:exonuclease III